MWRTSTEVDGKLDRVLTPSETRLFRWGVVCLIEERRSWWDRDYGATDVSLDERSGDEMPTGIGVVDAMSHGEFLTALCEVWRALTDPNLPAPDQHTAVHEGVIYAVYREVTTQAECEISHEGWADDEYGGRQFGEDHWYTRRLILDAWRSGRHDVYEADDDEDDEFTHGPRGASDTDTDTWDQAVESLADDVLWDRDFLEYSQFADARPEVAHAVREQMGIDHDYFTAVGGRLPFDELARQLTDILKTDGNGEVSLRATVQFRNTVPVGVSYSDRRIARRYSHKAAGGSDERVVMHLSEVEAADLKDYLSNPRGRKGRVQPVNPDKYAHLTGDIKQGWSPDHVRRQLLKYRSASHTEGSPTSTS